MKELSIEEKAKRYDLAIEAAKSIYNNMKEGGNFGGIEDLEVIFPELAEVDNERIRKGLISVFKDEYGTNTYFVGMKVKDIITWLEKQGDKDKLIQELGKYKIKYTQEVLEKHINSMSIKDDERLRKTTIAFLKDFAEQGYENAVECIDWLEKQKEQRDLLFQKMKEAGYKWENNQLIKIDNEDFVDLGLPSGTLWAKTNLGAEKESDFGKFFQWGDTKGYKGVGGHQFNWDEHKFGNYDSITKYNNTDDKLVLDNEDDPVFVATNGKFKTPTKDQLQELIDNTNHEMTTIDGVNGMKFINKNDSSKYIFIPAAGRCYNGSHTDVGSWGYVWSASRYESSARITWSMYFNAGDVDMNYSLRCCGYSVRGILREKC